jgi:hypothetical protein
MATHLLNFIIVTAKRLFSIFVYKVNAKFPTKQSINLGNIWEKFLYRSLKISYGLCQ